MTAVFAAAFILIAETAMSAESIYDFSVRTIDGKEASLSDYQGKALLIVNTASRCGYTPQYGSLQKLYAEYKERGFEVLAFPANNFMNQEPGDNAQIKAFCAVKYKTKFPIFSKISVKGGDIDPLFRYLTSQEGVAGDIRWNFTKFLVDPSGKVIARFEPPTDPYTAPVKQKLESILPKPAAA